MIHVKCSEGMVAFLVDDNVHYLLLQHTTIIQNNGVIFLYVYAYMYIYMCVYVGVCILCFQ